MQNKGMVFVLLCILLLVAFRADAADYMNSKMENESKKHINAESTLYFMQIVDETGMGMEGAVVSAYFMGTNDIAETITLDLEGRGSFAKLLLGQRYAFAGSIDNWRGWNKFPSFIGNGQEYSTLFLLESQLVAGDMKTHKFAVDSRKYFDVITVLGKKTDLRLKQASLNIDIVFQDAKNSALRVFCPMNKRYYIQSHEYKKMWGDRIIYATPGLSIQMF